MATNAQFEVLENRTLLSTALPTIAVGNSGSAAIIGRTLVIQGSDVADKIQVTAYFKTATVYFTNADVDETATFAVSDFDRIQVAAGDGDDTVRVDSSLPSGVTVHGNAGNDNLIVANGLVSSVVAPANTDWAHTVYPAVAYGDAGDDTISGDSDMYGGEGYDTVAFTDKAAYPLVYDTYEKRWMEDYAHPLYPVASLDDAANDGIFRNENVHSDVEVVLGYQGAVIASSVLPSTPIDGHTGSASMVDGTLVIQGSDDDDTISVSAQNGSTTVRLTNADVDETATFDNADFTQIQVTGGAGSDRITLDTSVTVNATLNGGAGDDSLTGGGGNDVLIGGDGDDTADYSMETEDLTAPYNTISLLSPDRGQDTLKVETLLSGRGDDRLTYMVSGSATNDVLRYIDGGAGNDWLGLESDVSVTLHGGDGNDTLYAAGDGVQEYYGDGGDDMFPLGRDGYWDARDFHGGAGIDTVDFSQGYTTVPIRVTIDDQPNDSPIRDSSEANFGDNVHSDVEVVIGSYANDTIIGSANDETLVGGGGDDCLVGNGGNDSLVGGSGNNTILDFLPASPPPASPPPASPPPASPPPPPAVTASPAVPFATVSNHLLSVNGTTGNDRITIRHKPGDASVLQVVRNGKIENFTFSDVKKITLNASNGNDFVDLRDITIGATLLGGNGNDSLYGSDGADSIHGGRGDDLLCGMAGNDSIIGGIGHDVIRGGEGIDRLFANKTSDDLNKNKGDTLVNDVLG